MLVLHRKEGESVVLSFLHIKIKITLLAIEGSRIKIGISAPSEVSIAREELLDRPLQPQQPGGVKGAK